MSLSQHPRWRRITKILPVPLRERSAVAVGRAGASLLEAAYPDSYNEDGLFAVRITEFLRDPDFAQAYENGVNAAGSDFGIRWRAKILLWAAEASRRLGGSIVELGTARGFYMSIVLQHQRALGDARPVFLFDTFGPGIGNLRKIYATDAASTQQTFARWDGVTIVPGLLPDSLEGVDVGRVSLLHIDLNHAIPEVESFRLLRPLLLPGAILVLDDYLFSASQYRAWNEVAKSFGTAIAPLPTGQGLMLMPCSSE